MKINREHIIECKYIKKISMNPNEPMVLSIATMDFDKDRNTTESIDVEIRCPNIKNISMSSFTPAVVHGINTGEWIKNLIETHHTVAAIEGEPEVDKTAKLFDDIFTEIKQEDTNKTIIMFLEESNKALIKYINSTHDNTRPS